MSHHSFAQVLARVTRVTQEFFPKVSGPANQALELSSGLERYNIRSPIFTTTLEHDPRVRKAGVDVYRFPPIFTATNFRLSPALISLLLKHETTLIHIHGWRNPISDGAIIAARRRRIPVILHAHGIAFGYRFTSGAPGLRAARQLYDTLMRRLVCSAAAIVIAGTNGEAADLYRYGFRKAQVTVLPAGVGANFFAAFGKRSSNHQPFSLLTVGRLNALRNIEQIIRALAQLGSGYRALNLRIVGPEVRLAAGDRDGYQQRLVELARSLGVERQVVFTGQLYGEALANEYRTASAFITTTRYENFGQPVAEAAAAGLPIIATPTGLAQELLADGATGLLVPFDDVEATAAAVGCLYNNPTLRLQYGAAAHSKVEHFAWEHIAQRYLELCQRLSETAPS